MHCIKLSEKLGDGFAKSPIQKLNLRQESAGWIQRSWRLSKPRCWGRLARREDRWIQQARAFPRSHPDSLLESHQEAWWIFCQIEKPRLADRRLHPGSSGQDMAALAGPSDLLGGGRGAESATDPVRNSCGGKRRPPRTREVAPLLVRQETRRNF